MKAFFIYRDGVLVGNPVGYTTRAGAMKSLLGCGDYYKLLNQYSSKFGGFVNYDELTAEERLSGMWKEHWSGKWWFQRDVWSRKVWQPYVKEHYKIEEKEFEIIIKD